MKTVVVALAVLLLLTLGTATGLALWLYATPGDWQHTVQLGGWRYELHLGRALKLATLPLTVRVLDGRTLQTPAGTVHLRRAPQGELLLRCRPCRLQVPMVSQQPLVLEEVRMSLVRRGERLRGGVLVNRRLQLRFTGDFDRRGLALEADLLPARIRDVYGVFAADIPELTRARIDGTLTVRARWRAPQGMLDVDPVVEGFRVQGLGTDLLRGRLPQVACTGAPRVPHGSAGQWLARAVVAAEDQRFYRHTGYDLQELKASLQRNSTQAAITRGGSTLSQQLARLLFTGSERTHVRKLRELLYAVEMEETLGKPRILQLYLQAAPWGRGVCGAEMAARAYYGKPAAQINRVEAAWLAAMLHTPEREFARWKATGRPNVARAKRVIDAMGGRAATRRKAAVLLAALPPPAAMPDDKDY